MRDKYYMDRYAVLRFLKCLKMKIAKNTSILFSFEDVLSSSQYYDYSTSLLISKFTVMINYVSTTFIPSASPCTRLPF